MSSRDRLFLFVFTIILATAFTPRARAQESVGYADPGQTSRLRDYRLPAWSYRTWDARFDLSGGGVDRSTAGSPAIDNNFQTRLGTDYNRSWESEPVDATFDWRVDGRYGRSHSGGVSNERRNSDVVAKVDLSGSLRRYLVADGIYVGGAGSLRRGYTERNAWSRSDTEILENNSYRRDSRLGAEIRSGWGRQRNVVPVLRAERLSERLAALGRPSLSDAQIRALAAVFATEYGYRQVFDRSDRHFWEDVLSPLLGDGPPLTPYEIFYLRDVLSENLGSRFEGFRAGIGWVWSESAVSTTGPTNKAVDRGAEAEAYWSHNPSLTRQISLGTRVRYEWSDSISRDDERATWLATASHLWSLADRYRWDVDLTYSQSSDVDREGRMRSIRGYSAFHVFVEDRIDIVTQVRLAYDWTRSPDVMIGNELLDNAVSDGWSWSYSVGLTYQLDRLFL